jgi:hypothetical protein
MPRALLSALLLLLGPSPAVSLENGLCRTPPMGYNAYMDVGGSGETGPNLVAMAQFFNSSGLARSGYTFVNSVSVRRFGPAFSCGGVRVLTSVVAPAGRGMGAEAARQNHAADRAEQQFRRQ